MELSSNITRLPRVCVEAFGPMHTSLAVKLRVTKPGRVQWVLKGGGEGAGFPVEQGEGVVKANVVPRAQRRPRQHLAKRTRAASLLYISLSVLLHCA